MSNIPSKSYSARSYYTGETARLYVDRRATTRKWRREHAILVSILERLPKGISILDVPVGTGRFLQDYMARGHKVVGVDISRDMLEQAERSAQGAEAQITLLQGDAENLLLPDASVECVVCFRFLNRVPFAVARNAIAEFSRVTRDRLILEIKVSERPGLFTLLRRIARPRTAMRVIAWALRSALGALRIKTPRSRARRTRDESAYPAEEVEAVFRQHGLAIETVVNVGEGQDGLRGMWNPVKVFVLRKGNRPAGAGASAPPNSSSS